MKKTAILPASLVEVFGLPGELTDAEIAEVFRGLMASGRIIAVLQQIRDSLVESGARLDEPGVEAAAEFLLTIAGICKRMLDGARTLTDQQRRNLVPVPDSRIPGFVPAAVRIPLGDGWHLNVPDGCGAPTVDGDLMPGHRLPIPASMAPTIATRMYESLTAETQSGHGVLSLKGDLTIVFWPCSEANAAGLAVSSGGNTDFIELDESSAWSLLDAVRNALPWLRILTNGYPEDDDMCTAQDTEEFVKGQSGGTLVSISADLDDWKAHLAACEGDESAAADTFTQYRLVG